MIYRYCVIFFFDPYIHLIRRIAYDNIELHIENLLWFIGMNKLVCVGFQTIVTVKLRGARSAPFAATIDEIVLLRSKADIPFYRIELAR
jgi:hypothetical protein